jgi:hypothetical protein
MKEAEGQQQSLNDHGDTRGIEESTCQAMATVARQSEEIVEPDVVFRERVWQVRGKHHQMLS